MSRFARAPGWKGPLRAIVERGEASNLLECGHTAPVGAQGKPTGVGKRQRCPVCPAEPPKSYQREERRAAQREARS